MGHRDILRLRRVSSKGQRRRLGRNSWELRGKRAVLVLARFLLRQIRIGYCCVATQVRGGLLFQTDRSSTFNARLVVVMDGRVLDGLRHLSAEWKGYLGPRDTAYWLSPSVTWLSGCCVPNQACTLCRTRKPFEFVPHTIAG